MQSRQSLEEWVQALMREQAGRTLMLHAAIAARLGVNITDLKCLDLVRAEPELTPSRVAASIGLSASAVTAVLDRLERGGFIERVRDTKDRRKVFIHTTGRRDHEVAELFAQLETRVGGILHECTADQLLFLGGILEQLNHHTCEVTVLVDEEPESIRSAGVATEA